VPVFLRNLWPSQEQSAAIRKQVLTPDLYKQVYIDISKGTDRWNQMQVSQGDTFYWDSKSTYIRRPPYFSNSTVEKKPIQDITDAYCLLNLGDSITTDHMSPAGKIGRDSAAGKYLSEQQVQPEDFDIYGEATLRSLLGAPLRTQGSLTRWCQGWVRSPCTCHLEKR
jgi:aconitate hydratase